jgi:hypothetical protein
VSLTCADVLLTGVKGFAGFDLGMAATQLSSGDMSGGFSGLETRGVCWAVGLPRPYDMLVMACHGQWHPI